MSEEEQVELMETFETLIRTIKRLDEFEKKYPKLDKGELISLLDGEERRKRAYSLMSEIDALFC